MPRNPCSILQNTIDKKELEFFRVLAAGVGLVVLLVVGLFFQYRVAATKT